MHCSLNLNIQQIFDLIFFIHVHLFIVNLYTFHLNTTWDIISVNCHYDVTDKSSNIRFEGIDKHDYRYFVYFPFDA